MLIDNYRTIILIYQPKPTVFTMISQTLKNLIKKKKKIKETLVLYCDICLQEQTLRGTPIRIKAMQKEFKRQHEHKSSFFKKLIGGVRKWI